MVRLFRLFESCRQMLRKAGALEVTPQTRYQMHRSVCRSEWNYNWQLDGDRLDRQSNSFASLRLRGPFLGPYQFRLISKGPHRRFPALFTCAENMCVGAFQGAKPAPRLSPRKGTTFQHGKFMSSAVASMTFGTPRGRGGQGCRSWPDRQPAEQFECRSVLESTEIRMSSCENRPLNDSRGRALVIPLDFCRVARTVVTVAS